jgi:hypothetical protein
MLPEALRALVELLYTHVYKRLQAARSLDPSLSLCHAGVHVE